jgi:YjbE family integral membrane protein
MELFSGEFFSALAAIIVIDLVLAGDNAIVIALAARGLPPHLRRRAILWGTFGAIAVRTAMTLVVVWLLRIPGLLAVGGTLLIWIAYKLLVDNEGESAHDGVSSTTFWGAMKTIVIADALMGLDNVLAVAGAAHGSFVLVVLGLLISIPVVIWGSQLVLKLVERYPAIVYVGSAVLAWTAVKMVTSEPLLAHYVSSYPTIVAFAYFAVLVGVLAGGFLANHRELRARVAGVVIERASAARGPLPVASSLGARTPMKILVPVDETANSLEALQHVVDRHVAQHRVEVHLLHVRQPFSELVARFTSRGNREAYHWDAAQKALEPARELLALNNVAHTDHIELGDKAEAIDRTANALGVAKIVMGTARRNSLTRLLEDSVTSRVLNVADVPVEVVVGRDVSKLEYAGVSAAAAALLAVLLLVAN